VNFVIVYQQEAHAADSENALELNAKDGFSLVEPLTLGERQKAAQQLVERMGIKQQAVVVDAWNNTSALRYGSYPNMTFIIDAKGVLQAGYPWMDPAKVAGTLDSLLAGRPLTAEMRGSVKPSAAPALDVTGAAMDMSGGRGPAGVALALDRVSLTEAQRQKLLPALGKYFAELQAFRQARGGGPAPNGAAPGRVNRGAAATRPMITGETAPERMTPQEALAQLRKTSEELKVLIKETLNEKDAANLLNALEQTQVQRLFAAPR
jgi:hypothetical protein